MPIKAVIFDLDGTITRPFLDFDEIRREMGIAGDAGPILEIMQNMTEPQRRSAEAILHKHEQQAVRFSRLNPGAAQTIDALRSRGIKIGIVTRNRRENALEIAKKHNLSFDAIVDRHDGPVKPDAFGLLQLCKQFNVRPEETLMVGDYLHDMLCAKAAKAIGVLLKNHKMAENFVKYADFVINKLDGVLAIIQDINRNPERFQE